ncbi:MAG: glycosyltransferase family 2 protein [Myxococcales bacterium]|nr:glycosyltransferase family 2 protein [Myxococcales bacterium]
MLDSALLGMRAMLGGKCITALVPAHNEALHLRATVDGIPTFVDQVIIIEDGSRDGTLEVARALLSDRVHLIQHSRRRGVGAALQSGYRRAFGGQTDVAVVMAGDGQMHPDDLHRLVDPILAGEADYTKGNRLAHSTYHRMPRLRRFGTRAFSMLTHWCTGLRVQDSQCGYTALSREAYHALGMPSLWPGYGYVNDILARCAHHGLRVRDVIVRPVYGAERSGLKLYHAFFVVPFVLVRSVLRRGMRGSALLAKARATSTVD